MVNKSSRTAKVIAGFVGFATAVTMSFGTASAATTADIAAQIAALQAQLATLSAQSGTTVATGYTFATNLKVGSKGTDVMNLQKVLNSNPATQVAKTGAGSPGMETTTFGPATKAAVIKFQELNAAAILTPVGLTKGTGIVGASMRAFLNSMSGTTGGTTTGGTTTGTVTGGIRLASDTPAATVIIAGQAIADLAHFTFPNTTGAELKVTNLVFNRIGVSNDDALSNVYLYNGVKRLTDAAAVSSGKITFSDSNGLFTIPAGGTLVLSVKADIGSSSNGQTVGVALTSAKAGTTDLGVASPISGNVMSVATAGTIASISWGGTTSPLAGTQDLQVGLVMWQNTVSVTNRAVNLSTLTLRQIGSVSTSDLASLQLYVDGKPFGTAVASTDANGFVTFTVATPVKLETGNHDVKLIGDVVSGSTKTFSWSLQQAGDAVFADSQLGVPVVATSFTSLTTGTQTIVGTNGGGLSITKAIDAPSGNVVLSGTNVLLGKYTFKATGEQIKVENIRVAIASSKTGSYDDDFALRNGALYANGVQIGNTAAIREDNNTTLGYTLFNLGSALIVTPGTPVTVEVRADVYNNGTSALVAGDTLQTTITTVANSWKKMASLKYNDGTEVVTALASNALTVAQGSISGSKNASYANQTVVIPQTAYKIGSFTVTNTDAEAINLNTINVNLSAGASIASGDVTDLYVKYGTKTTTVKATPSITDSTTANVYSINETLNINDSMTFEVYGTLNTSITTSKTVIAKLYVSGLTSVSAATKAITETTGQTISNAAGSMSAAVVTGSDTATKLLVGNTTPKVASFRFTALNDTFSITDLGLTFAASQNGSSAVAAGAIRNIVLKSSGMTDKIVNLTSATTATSTGMSLSVPANDSNGRVVDVYLNLNDVGASAATSSADIIVTLASYKALTSTGTVYNGGGVAASGQDMYVYKSIPTITPVTLGTTLLTAGTMALSKFTIAADSAGPIGWKKIAFTVAKTAATEIYGTSTMALKDSSGTTIPGVFATSTSPAGGSTTSAFGDQATSGTIIFVATNEQQITTSETYTLYDTVSGTINSGKYITTSIAAPSTFAAPNTYASVSSSASFVWTDRSSNSHGVGTPDWNNDYKVKNLPTDTQTLSGSGT